MFIDTQFYCLNIFIFRKMSIDTQISCLNILYFRKMSIDTQNSLFKYFVFSENVHWPQFYCLKCFSISKMGSWERVSWLECIFNFTEKVLYCLAGNWAEMDVSRLARAREKVCYHLAWEWAVWAAFGSVWLGPSHLLRARRGGVVVPGVAWP
jgi:hypothetical protein